jgi:hypothetical protein
MRLRPPRESRDWPRRLGRPDPLARQAVRERDAWVEAGWEATIHESTPAVRAEIREWERAKRVRV